MSDPTPFAQRPNRVPWPPLILVGCAALAILLARLLPPPTVWPELPGRVIGGGVMLAGGLLDLWAQRTMRGHHANILPHRAATTLVTTGPFALTRNPLYLGNTLLLVGLAGMLANPWCLAAAGLEVWLVTSLAIRREEAHLAAKFGVAWHHYARRTPRWLRLGQAPGSSRSA